MKTVKSWIEQFKDELLDNMPWIDEDPKDISFVEDKEFLESEFNIKFDGLKFICFGEGLDIKIIDKQLHKGVRCTNDPILYLALNNGYELTKHLIDCNYLNCPYGTDTLEVKLLKNSETKKFIVIWINSYGFHTYALSDDFIELIIENASDIANLSWKDWETGKRYDQDGDLII